MCIRDRSRTRDAFIISFLTRAADFWLAEMANLIHGFQCFDFGIFMCIACSRKRLVLTLYILLNVFVRYYRNYDIITLNRFQTKYQSLLSIFRSLENGHILSVPQANVVGFFDSKIQVVFLANVNI